MRYSGRKMSGGSVFIDFDEHSWWLNNVFNVLFQFWRRRRRYK